MLGSRGSDAISATAHYTGHVWARNGMSDPALETLTGRGLYLSVEPLMAVNRVLGLPTFEGGLLARHRVIDDLLERAIEEEGVDQVIEVAAGLSPRGMRFSRRYGDALTYVEADLPAMAARKRGALGAGAGGAHRVVELDALAEDGPRSVPALAETLDPARGTVIITEGLLNYFDLRAVEGMWRRFATALGSFPQGLYLSDLYLGPRRGIVEQAAIAALSAFVRGRVHLHLTSPDHAQAAIRAAGFASVKLHRADTHPAAGDRRGDPGARLVHVVQARA